ncbi:alginate export family protein [Pseudomonas sp. NPDC090592]|uniref:alginate export family protein n=1 Tax=Pseudomonas sp. NPDC090592 TaxID=3364480 RepID=UPI003839E50E
MKNTITALKLVVGACALLCASATVYADDVLAPPDVQNARPLRPGIARWAEDYSFLRDPAKRTDPLDALRYVPFGESNWVTFGGEMRYRADSHQEPFFGLRGRDSNSYLQQRLQVHADVHLLDDQFRIFAQLQDTKSWRKAFYSPNDQSDTEFQQLFVDWNLQLPTGYKLTTRVGRQEMVYGSQVFISDRDAPNLRFNLDGVRLMLKTPGGYKVDAFAMRPVAYGLKSFDDESSDDIFFAGLYSTFNFSKPWNLDVYALDLETKNRSLAGVSGDEVRYTTGTRIFGKAAGFDWTWDVAGQFGHLDDANIRAWAVAGTSGYTFDAPWQPRIGLRTDVASGDSRRGDNRVGTFDPLYGKNGYYGEAGITTLSNLIVVGPQVAFSPLPSLRIEPAIFGVWKQQAEDGVYFTGMGLAPGTTNTESRHVGTIYKTNVRWLATRNLTVDFDWEYLAAGNALQEAGGKSVHFVSVRPTLRF